MSDDTVWRGEMARNPERTRSQAAAVMLVSGADFATIAQVMDFPSQDAARLAAEKALADSFDSWDKAALKKVLTGRLEALWRVAYSRASNDRYAAKEAATGNALKIIDRLTKMYGVDEPTQVVMHSATSAQINEWVARVTAKEIEALPAEEDIFDAEIVEEETLR